MEVKVRCHLSADALSELRRKVHHTRKVASLPTREAGGAEIISHDMRVIAEFITDEFEADVLALFQSRVQPEAWPEITSWDYPGPWINTHSETVIRVLDGEESVYIFSKSGDHHLYISKVE